MDCSEIVFSGHAVRRMFDRQISTATVTSVIRLGEAIAEYPEDVPYPSVLVLGFVEGKPVHVVVARDPNDRRCYVITAYIPDPRLWGPDFRTRRQP
jgi:hypothetical protein